MENIITNNAPEFKELIFKPEELYSSNKKTQLRSGKEYIRNIKKKNLLFELEDKSESDAYNKKG